MRLRESLLDEARKLARTEGVALNQFINVTFFRERAGRGDIAKAKRILRRAGRGKPPAPGDEAE